MYSPPIRPARRAGVRDLPFLSAIYGSVYNKPRTMKRVFSRRRRAGRAGFLRFSLELVTFFDYNIPVTVGARAGGKEDKT